MKMESETESNLLLDFSVRHGVDLRECLEDSPDLREHLEEHEKEISGLEASLERMVQLCNTMISMGNKYNNACKEFGMHLKEIGKYFSDSENVVDMLKQTSELFGVLSSLHSVLFDHVQRGVQSAIKNFLWSEFGKLRESKRSFDRTAEEYNTALHKNAQSPKSKPLEAEEASKSLQLSTVTFTITAMDHAYQINHLQSKKGYEVLEKVASMVRAQLRFFSDGCDALKKFEPVMESMGVEADELKKDFKQVSERMERRHSLTRKLRTQSKERESLSPSSTTSQESTEDLLELKGFLFKRGSSKFKTWNRRYFTMAENQLSYLKKGPMKEIHLVAEDLRLCAVKHMEDIERRFCFEIVAPTKTILLQADSDLIRKKWVSAIQASIANAFRDSSSVVKRSNDGTVGGETVTDQSRVLKRLAKVPGNDVCADCGSAGPTWASINIGVLLCIECSGIHRSLGVHISKVRSVTLDAWEPEVQRVMLKLGNAIANSILEYNVPDGLSKPTASSSRAEKEKWIKAKYVQHSFVHLHTTNTACIQTTAASSPDLPALTKLAIPSSEELLADDSAPESEYDSKSLRRKKKQNKIRRWAMDKLMKRSASSKESFGRDSPLVSEDTDSIGSKSELFARTLTLRQRPNTINSNEQPPPKPPRSRKAKSMALIEPSVIEPLLSTGTTEDQSPLTVVTANGHPWYKGSRLFENDNEFSESIMEVIKNIGYTCESPKNDNDEVIASNDSTNCVEEKSTTKAEEVIVNGSAVATMSPVRVLVNSNPESDQSMFMQQAKSNSTPTTDTTVDAVDGDEDIEDDDDDAFDNALDEIPDEFQRYEGDLPPTETPSNTDVSTNSKVSEEASSIPVPLHQQVKPSISTSDVSLDFFSAHSSPINSGTSGSYRNSPLQCELPAYVQVRRPAKRLEKVASSEDEAASSTSLLTEGSAKSSPKQLTADASKDSIDELNAGEEPIVNTLALSKESVEATESTLAEEVASTNSPAEQFSDVGPSVMVLSTSEKANEGASNLQDKESPTLSVGETRSSQASPLVKLVKPAGALTIPSDPLELFTSDDELDDGARAEACVEPVIIPLSKSAHEFLYTSALAGNLPGMLCALAHGANVNFMNSAEELKCPLIGSILTESLEATEFLLQNGAKLHLRDARGRGCLHHAAATGAVGHVCLLLKRGTVAHLYSVDEMGKDALDIAVEQGNGDIVTMLRLAKLNDEMIDDQQQNKALQETVSLVYRDIKHSSGDFIDGSSPMSPQQTGADQDQDDSNNDN